MSAYRYRSRANLECKSPEGKRVVCEKTERMRRADTVGLCQRESQFAAERLWDDYESAVDGVYMCHDRLSHWLTQSQTRRFFVAFAVLQRVTFERPGETYHKPIRGLYAARNADASEWLKMLSNFMPTAVAGIVIDFMPTVYVGQCLSLSRMNEGWLKAFELGTFTVSNIQAAASFASTFLEMADEGLDPDNAVTKIPTPSHLADVPVGEVNWAHPSYWYSFNLNYIPPPPRPLKEVLRERHPDAVATSILKADGKLTKEYHKLVQQCEESFDARYAVPPPGKLNPLNWPFPYASASAPRERPKVSWQRWLCRPLWRVWEMATSQSWRCQRTKRRPAWDRQRRADAAAHAHTPAFLPTGGTSRAKLQHMGDRTDLSGPELCAFVDKYEHVVMASLPLRNPEHHYPWEVARSCSGMRLTASVVLVACDAKWRVVKLLQRTRLVPSTRR